jgi:hypothetical protein
VKWLLIAIALLIGCGLASWYAHLYYEDDDQDNQGDAATPAVAAVHGAGRFRNAPLPLRECNPDRRTAAGLTST